MRIAARHRLGLVVFAICAMLVLPMAGRADSPAATTQPATQPAMSDLARKLAAGMPEGWKLTGHGRCDAPSQWSPDPALEKNAGEYLSFQHDTFQAVFPPGPAAFGLSIMPVDYVARLYETNLAQAGGEALSWVGKEHLLFMQGGAPERHEDWAPVEAMIQALGFVKAPAADITPEAAKVAHRVTALAAEDKDKKLPGSGSGRMGAVGYEFPWRFSFAAVAKATNEPLVIPDRCGTAYVSQWFQFTERLAGDADTRFPYPLNYTLQVKAERPILKGEQVLWLVRIENSERLAVQALPDTLENREAVKDASTHPATAPDAQDGQWLPVAQGALAKVEVEKVLYDAPGDPHFWIHFRITNITDKQIGVDLRDSFGVMYPNQWGWSQTIQRLAIDERRRTFSPLSATQGDTLLEDYRRGNLAAIAPHAGLDYFIAFNNTSVALSRKENAGKYVIISLDGQLLPTDGAKVDQISLGILSPGGGFELSIPAPVAWEPLPAGARIVGESPAPTTQPAK